MMHYPAPSLRHCAIPNPRLDADYTHPVSSQSIHCMSFLFSARSSESNTCDNTVVNIFPHQ